ncbi:MAG: tetratricopeptide repeat protein [Pirellulales bacterium]
MIGGGGNRPNWNNGNTNINNINNIANHINNNNWNNININNRPGWGWGGGPRPGWDNWSNHWYDHHIPGHYHGWYHGGWNGNWANNWYVPFAIGVTTGWATTALWNNWGYGYNYYNPYYAASAAPVYDYAQPVVVNNYVQSGDTVASDPNAAPAVAPEPTAGQRLAFTYIDQAREEFKNGDYAAALRFAESALAKSPGDPVVHEFRALCLFALGKYQEAAAGLNALLATSPGMDWTTLSGLYGDIDDYTKQLRALEQHCKANPRDGAAAFDLAYQYLVTGNTEAAISALQVVVAAQPKDGVAKRMLAALKPPTETAPTPEPTPDPNAPTTDLVGTWTAKTPDTTIQLTVTDDSHFTWKAKPTGKPEITLTGDLSSSEDTLVLQSEKEGSMVGKVKSGGADAFQFTLVGAQADQGGLSFTRMR